MKIVVDTSVIIDHTRANLGSFRQILKELQSGKCDLYLPSVVVTELWSGKETENKKSAKKLEKLLESFRFVDLDKEGAKSAGIISRDYNVDGFDAIIATCTIKLNAYLATSNTKHFLKIKNLKLYSR